MPSILSLSLCCSVRALTPGVSASIPHSRMEEKGYQQRHVVSTGDLRTGESMSNFSTPFTPTHLQPGLQDARVLHPHLQGWLSTVIHLNQVTK